MEAQKKYGIRGFPAILFISPDGGVIKNHSGYMPPDNFLPVMEDVLKKETEFQEKLAKYEENPDDVKLSREIAILFLQRQQIEKALPISKKMPDDVELNREIGFYYLGKNQIDEALQISEKMPDDVKLNSRIAITYLKHRAMEFQQKIELALSFSNKVIEKDPKNSTGLLPNLHIEIGLAYAMQLQIQAGKEDVDVSELAENAVMHFQKIIDNYPKSNVYDRSQYYLGITYSLNKQYDKSIEALEKLINHTGDDQMKQAATRQLERVKGLAAEAGETSDN